MPQDVPNDSRSRTPSTIAEGLTVDGDVSSTGALHIDGRVKGDVRCVSLILGETSEIEGNVMADEVMIHGRLIGSVRGRRVMLQSTSHVEGDVLHQNLAMEQGAYFQGESRRSKNSLSGSASSQREDVEEPMEGQSIIRKSSGIFKRALRESDSVET